MTDLERILQQNEAAEDLLSYLRFELLTIRNELILKKKQELSAENVTLRKQVENAKSTLVQLENQNGKMQIPIPGESVVRTQVNDDKTKEIEKPVATEPPTCTQKPLKEKKPRKEKATGESSVKNNPPSNEAPVDVGRLDFRIGKIIEVSKHPDADSLYVEKIDCGEPNPRTVVSGLVKYVPIEEMQNRMVVLLCNLKPAKMRGITSEAMVMCASTPEKVEILTPPAGVLPGDLVYCEGYNRVPDAVLNPKKKIFETCAPDLKTNSELIACYKNSSLHVPGKGNVVAASLKDAPVK